MSSQGPCSFWPISDWAKANRDRRAHRQGAFAFLIVPLLSVRSRSRQKTWHFRQGAWPCSWQPRTMARMQPVGIVHGEKKESKMRGVRAREKDRADRRKRWRLSSPSGLVYFTARASGDERRASYWVYCQTFLRTAIWKKRGRSKRKRQLFMSSHSPVHTLMSCRGGLTLECPWVRSGRALIPPPVGTFLSAPL